MFGKKEDTERKIKMVQEMKITSKVALKQYCLIATRCDVGEAQKLYDFLIKDMDELPMFDPIQPTWFDNTKRTAADIFGFIKENQDDIAKGIELMRGLIGKNGSIKNVAEATALPPINA